MRELLAFAGRRKKGEKKEMAGLEAINMIIPLEFQLVRLLAYRKKHSFVRSRVMIAFYVQ